MKQTVMYPGTLRNSGWKLLSYTTRSAGSEILTSPCGAEPTGLLMYGESNMSVMICKCHLNGVSGHIPTVPACDRTPGTDFIFYSGSYSYDENTGIISHRPETSCISDWVNTTQQRHVSLTGNILELRTVTPLLLNGQEQHASLIWERVF